MFQVVKWNLVYQDLEKEHNHRNNVVFNNSTKCTTKNTQQVEIPLKNSLKTDQTGVERMIDIKIMEMEDQ